MSRKAIARKSSASPGPRTGKRTPHPAPPPGPSLTDLTKIISRNLVDENLRMGVSRCIDDAEADLRARIANMGEQIAREVETRARLTAELEDLSSVAMQANAAKETAERHLETALSERDLARHERDEARRDLAELKNDYDEAEDRFTESELALARQARRIDHLERGLEARARDDARQTARADALPPVAFSG